MLPNLINRDANRKLPVNPRSKALAVEQVAEIRIRYHEAPDEKKRNLKRELFMTYDISRPTLALILECKT